MALETDIYSKTAGQSGTRDELVCARSNPVIIPGPGRDGGGHGMFDSRAATRR